MNILMVTGIEGARNCATVVGEALNAEVEVACGRKAALAALRGMEYAAVVVDETLAECDPAAAEAIWAHAGLAIPLQINFALSGAARLIREIARRAAPPRAGADAGPPRRRRGHGDGAEVHRRRPAAALSTGPQRRRAGGGGRQVAGGGGVGRQPAPPVEPACGGDPGLAFAERRLSRRRNAHESPATSRGSGRERHYLAVLPQSTQTLDGRHEIIGAGQWLSIVRKRVTGSGDLAGHALQHLCKPLLV